MLKGSRLIILNALSAMLDAGKQPSVNALAERSGYSRRTVFRALAALRTEGCIEYEARTQTYKVMAAC